MKMTGPTEVVMWASVGVSLISAVAGAAVLGNMSGAGVALVIAVVITMVTFAERRRVRSKHSFG
ncbi:hypothetical protein ACFQZ2_09400 [Streptomonospora algeriensis]|uniref:Uncharacterized protein n=1 Tax=Streptomonospora algeriensis TaxID=995084 RepID=A0ABW3BCB5_9ACTN